MTKSLETLQSEIEERHKSHTEDMESYIEEGLREVGYKWQLQYPKRSIRFMDAMGMAGWLVLLKNEWEWITELVDTYHPHVDAYEKIFAELLDSYEWYADMSDLTQICIGDIELEPLQDSMDLAEMWEGWTK